MERLADPEVGTLDGVVDLDRYPLGSPDLGAWSALVAEVRRGLAADGAVTLPGFLTADALRATAAELSATVEHVPIRTQHASVYHRRELEGRCAPDDPRTVQLEWHAGHVTRDMIPPYACSHRLYASGLFKRFVAACTGRDRVYEYADPLAGLVATVLPPGGRYPWHYDTNEFVITIMIQRPDAGGLFEYHHDLRRPGDENLDGLARVLDGSAASSARVVDNEPGDLQLFLGRYSLHQVTRVDGDTSRLVLVLSYSDRPGVIGPLDRTRSVYGRVTEAHLVAAQMANAASDGLIL